jgi:hypothetical protein
MINLGVHNPAYEARFNYETLVLANSSPGNSNSRHLTQ